jgi:toxin secretion/phage lysis holin
MQTPEKAKEIRALFAMVLAFFTALWGWIGWTIFLWILMILMDYITGSMVARREKNWSSEIARDGLWHKSGEIFAVLVAALCDIALGVIAEGAGIVLPFEIGPMLTPIVLLWYILTEVGSIIENCGRLGAPMPKWFKAKVDQYKEAIDKSQESGGDQPSPAAEDTPGKHDQPEISNIAE